jgi:hypothetical protein
MRNARFHRGRPRATEARKNGSLQRASAAHVASYGQFVALSLAEHDELQKYLESVSILKLHWTKGGVRLVAKVLQVTAKPPKGGGDA